MVARSSPDRIIAHSTITVSLSYTTRNIAFSGGFSIRRDIRSRYKHDTLEILARATSNEKYAHRASSLSKKRKGHFRVPMSSEYVLTGTIPVSRHGAAVGETALIAMIRDNRHAPAIARRRNRHSRRKLAVAAHR